MRAGVIDLDRVRGICSAGGGQGDKTKIKVGLAPDWGSLTVMEGRPQRRRGPTRWYCAVSTVLLGLHRAWPSLFIRRTVPIHGSFVPCALCRDS